MTTQASSTFFADQANALALRRLAQDVRSLPSAGMQPQGLPENLAQILDLMISHAQAFDEFCASNIEWIGTSFMNEVTRYFDLPQEKRSAALQSIFTSAYRFLSEFDFAQPADPSFEIRRVLAFGQENLNEFPERDRQQLVFAAYTMTAQVAKRLINHPSIADFRTFAATVESSRKLRDDWDSDMKRREDRLGALDKNLKKITSAYNFVGLVNGFQGLRDKKDGERKFALLWLVVIALFMAAPPITQIGFVLSKLDTIETHKLTLAYTLPTIVALELILLYLFRVVLVHFRSLKAQLLQLDLRVALCQFIESYAEYATRIKTQDSGALAKFEALVFSGLVTDESGLPSTFDGAEQVANLIRSLRGGGGKPDA